MELLVVNFHYFREELYSSGIYPVSRQRLLNQVETLAKEHVFISQSELVQIIKSGLFPRKKFCLLTFDDGLKEQMGAFRLLESKGIPSIFYVPTKPIASATVLEVHQLHHVRTQHDDEDLFQLLDAAHGISHHAFDTPMLAIQYRYDSDLSRKVKYFLNFELGEVERKTFVQSIFSKLVNDEGSFSRSLYMDIDDLRTLAATGALGSHGSTHCPLARLTPEEARKDMVESLDFLRTITGRIVSSFSYPYGGKSAISEQLGEILKETSVTFALTMERGVNSDSDFQRPFFLKRVDTNDAPGGKSSTGSLN